MSHAIWPVICLAAIASPALAGSDIDIEKLKCEPILGPEFVLCVDYCVEVEGRPPAALELRLQVLECGRQMVEPDGAPIELVIPLDQPTEIDDDEAEFEGQVKFVLPHAPAYIVSNYAARAVVTSGVEHKRAHDVETARAETPRPRRISIGFRYRG